MEVQTSKETELVDITERVKGSIESENVNNGFCVVFSKHTTTGIIINENEPRLKEDILNMLEEIVPSDKDYLHDEIDSNAHSHLRSILLGSSVVVPIENGSLSLGTWQSIFLVELDGPRRRTVNVSIMK
ncbi:MAG: secondary thiamine-phosphate synthase enzyme YjbQ [Methanocellales archaeon]|nr:secondary thiamine-phosphate synthase enzyme YjbQ [Methanocellales archaeon]MDD3420713.1 secondary thiamine-phosphate synthase enzyme YjbQ [Methanocellales archaeon]MDD4898072.1 secondary thiamine-phosphate synthase enzyme YjbQ [Methanocellales archaeon]MDD5446839.1 secondary thiamine-phosphate synthase enzyme YjbQ [Methanocellales archaeon]